MERKDKKTNDGYLNSDTGFVSFVSVTQRRNDIQIKHNPAIEIRDKWQVFKRRSLLFSMDIK